MGLYVLKFPARRLLQPLARALGWVHPDVLSYVVVGGIAASGLCEPVWGVLALGSMVLAYCAMLLGRALDLDRPELGPLGAAGRLTVVIFFSLVHFLYLRNGWGRWTLLGLSVSPLGCGMVGVTVLAQMAALNRAREALRRMICLKESTRASCGGLPEGGQVCGRGPQGWLMPR